MNETIKMRRTIPEDLADLVFKELAVKYIRAQDRKFWQNPMQLLLAVNDLKFAYHDLGDPVIKV